jgi:hypothetical protein
MLREVDKEEPVRGYRLVLDYVDSEETDWRARRNCGGDVDCGGACGGGGGEYVPDIFVESADVAGCSGEGGGC